MIKVGFELLQPLQGADLASGTIRAPGGHLDAFEAKQFCGLNFPQQSTDGCTY